ncbi:hypothetical protein J6590_003352 [Homalodisca vitripennis]|nr:hypothetical protein J6590_003352 [Homalodisca vitripennis]
MTYCRKNTQVNGPHRHIIVWVDLIDRPAQPDLRTAPHPSRDGSLITTASSEQFRLPKPPISVFVPFLLRGPF